MNHGVDEEQVYRLGVAVFSLKDPLKLLYRHPEPILEPEADYEIRGGRVPNVVFACGATVDKEEMLGIFVYEIIR